MINKGLLVMQWNCCSIYRKLPELKIYLSSLPRMPDVIMIQETHLYDKYNPKDAPDRHNQPLENNLRSYSLWSRADSKVQDWRQAKGASAWLQAYAKIAGEKAARRLLEEQKVSRDSDLWKAVRQ